MQTQVTCSKCGGPKERTWTNEKTGWIHRWCIPCSNKRTNEWARRTGKRRDGSRRWRAAHLEQDREIKRNYFRKLKLDVIHAYGDRCVCCGISEPRALSIDHIKNDGAAHRRELGKDRSDQRAVYLWLRKNGYPPGIVQVMCMNCNTAKAWYGACDHVPQTKL